MLLEERVVSNPVVCGIEVDLSGKEFASGNFNVQPFYNTTITDGNFREIYSSSGSVSFQEDSEESEAGISYVQTLTMKFPSFDKNRSQRISELRKLKFVSLKLSEGNPLLLGRNDFFMNIRPKVSVRSSQKVTLVRIVTQSIFPVGFSGNTVPYGFSYELPVSMLEAI